MQEPDARRYPYDPKYDAFSASELAAECQRLDGLNKLRTLRDRHVAANLAVLYGRMEHDEKRRNPLAEQRRADAAELAEGERAIRAVLDGQAGEELRELTASMFPKFAPITLAGVRKWRELRFQHAARETR